MPARSSLIRQITEVIEANGWPQMEAGTQCGITQPRINVSMISSVDGSHAFHWMR
ncbi:MAG: XRE family transcriptional regulator [Nitrospira sp.]|nr:XRE family transcriptional regulator [Nitrospira sp.]